jgi:hypothetical protein
MLRTSTSPFHHHVGSHGRPGRARPVPPDLLGNLAVKWAVRCRAEPGHLCRERQFCPAFSHRSRAAPMSAFRVAGRRMQLVGPIWHGHRRPCRPSHESQKTITRLASAAASTVLPSKATTQPCDTEPGCPGTCCPSTIWMTGRFTSTLWPPNSARGPFRRPGWLLRCLVPLHRSAHMVRLSSAVMSASTVPVTEELTGSCFSQSFRW